MQRFTLRHLSDERATYPWVVKDRSYVIGHFATFWLAYREMMKHRDAALQDSSVCPKVA